MVDDSLLREVNEDVRAERLMAAWRQYRSLLLVVVVSIVVATVGHTLWNNYRTARGGEWFTQLSQAQTQLGAGKFADAEKGFAAVAQAASGDLKALAEIWQARALIAQGKTAEASAVLQATTAHATGLWGDIACLRLAAVDAKAATCLGKTQSSPLKWQRTQWAVAERWHAGEVDKAIAMLDDLVKTNDIPEAARTELAQWLVTMKEKP